MERYRDLALKIKRIHRATKVEATTIMIGALGTISKNAKPAWYWRLHFWKCTVVSNPCISTPLILTKVLSKLQEAAEAWLRSPEENTRELEGIAHH